MQRFNFRASVTCEQTKQDRSAVQSLVAGCFAVVLLSLRNVNVIKYASICSRYHVSAAQGRARAKSKRHCELDNSPWPCTEIIVEAHEEKLCRDGWRRLPKAFASEAGEAAHLDSREHCGNSSMAFPAHLLPCACHDMYCC